MNRQVVLVSRPKGMPELSNFDLTEANIPSLQEGEALIKTLYLSVDPYMRGRLGGRPSSHPPFPLNRSLTGDGVGRVEVSKNPRYQPGDIVSGILEWADYSIIRDQPFMKIDYAPVTTALGILGMPGMTAYFGILDIGQPKKGETVVVSAAAGAVGMIVGQIAKIQGCKVIGIVGSDEKAGFLMHELGFDGAVNYKKPEFVDILNAICPQGVDVYFDNVGGDITDQVLKLINKHARIVLCGQIATYNLEKPDIGPRSFRTLIVKSAMAKGLIAFDYKGRFEEAREQLVQWIAEGKIKSKESVIEGLENTPRAFLGLFSGANIGKQIVKITE